MLAAPRTPSSRPMVPSRLQLGPGLDLERLRPAHRHAFEPNEIARIVTVHSARDKLDSTASNCTVPMVISSIDFFATRPTSAANVMTVARSTACVF
jgi:hypothetical protein